MKLPTIISEFSGYDDGQPVFDVTLHPTNGDECKHDQVFAGDHDQACYLAACGWQIDDYAFKHTGSNP